MQVDACEFEGPVECFDGKPEEQADHRVAEPESFCGTSGIGFFASGVEGRFVGRGDFCRVACLAECGGELGERFCGCWRMGRVERNAGA